MRRTNIYLTDCQCAQLDQRARARGVSRAALIRRLLDECLARETGDVADDIAALHDSFGVLSDDDIQFDRGQDDRMRHLDAIARR